MYTPPAVPSFVNTAVRGHEDAATALLFLYRGLFDQHKRDLNETGRSTVSQELFAVELKLAEIGVSLRERMD
jgi:hypothetical protein